MPRVWELLSYLRGDGEQQNQPDGKLRQMRETSLPVDPASRRELDDLHSKVAQQRQEIADLTNELSSYRTREEAAAARLADQLADCDRLKAELAEARDDLQERDRQLQLGSQQLRTRQAQVEDAQLELNQKAAELLITAQQLAKVEISAQEARSEADRLSQQVTEQNKQLAQLESQLATARLAVAAAAAAAAPPPPPPPPPPPSIDPAEVEALREELASVRESLRVSEEQRMQEIHMIQEALEEALKENATLESRYRREVEQLKTVTAERETQLMDDAETRLREMQYDWKRKLEEREKAVEERAKIARKSIEDELESLRNHRRDMDIVGGEQKVTEVELLRSFEAEVVQLRGLSHELMRELRAGNRQVEVAKMAEAMAADENRRLNELVRKQNGTISSIQKELQRVQQRTDTQEHQGRAALEAQWEDRLRQERSALKAELDSLHAEEKHLAVESVRVQLEQKLNSAKQEQEQTVRRLEQELSTAREEVIQKDESHYFEIKRIKKQANSDLCALQEKLRHSYENSKPEPIVQQTKDPSPVVNGLGSESDEEEDENDNEEGDEEAEEEDFFDVEDSEAAGEEIRRQHRRDLELLLRTSQDQRADLQLMLERYEARTACTQEELRMLHAERSGPHTEAGPARRPVPGAARLAAVLTALQECGDQLVRLISARDEQRLRQRRLLS